MYQLVVLKVTSVAAYPSAIQAANVSRTTIVGEIIEIGDIEKEVFKRNNINLLSGPVNAVDYATEMFNMPEIVSIPNLIKDDIEKYRHGVAV